MSLNRRTFLKSAALVAASGIACPAFCQTKNPNSKLNVACIGTSGRAAASVDGVRGENIVALCDVFAPNLEKRKEQFPGAKFYADFRKMYDDFDGKLDAVTVGTPDHTHAVASVWGMRQGVHCYCEKPLCHNIAEVKRMMSLAEKKKLVTQMGTQIHATENYRRAVELVRSGAIGKVDKAYAWVGKSWGGQKLPQETPPVPAGLDWDLWLGPAPMRPYHPIYAPAGWRNWWAFGNGTLGDMGCHLIDLIFWTFNLSYPKTAEAIAAEKPNAESAPGKLEVRYTIPRPGENDLELTWYDGMPKPASFVETMSKFVIPPDKPDGKPSTVADKGMGVFFLGSDGAMFADYGEIRLFPHDKYERLERPKPSIPPSKGHYEEWIAAIKNGKREDALCRFEYSGPLTTTVLLGSIAFRVGRKLEWDAKKGTVTNCPEAVALLSRKSRPGWEID